VTPLPAGPLSTASVFSGVEAAVHAAEVQAARGFLLMVVVFGTAVLLGLPFMDFDPRAMTVLVIGCAIALPFYLYSAWALRRPGNYYHRGNTAVLAMAASISGFAGVYFFGFFSPALLATAMSLFFFGMSRHFAVALTIYVATAVSYTAAMLLMVAGVMEDRGVIRVVALSDRSTLVGIFLTQVIFALTFAIARSIQRALHNAAVGLEAQTRALAQREALLEEARRDLEQVLEIGGPGRFTEQRLGSFQLGVLCGRGAMGDVYEARHVVSGEPAAVKLLHRDTLRQPGQVRRFLREARIAASVQVANVVRVIEVGDDDAPIPYLAMELLHGRDLAAILRKRRRLPVEEVAELLRQVGRGLDAAHRAGVVHRDLKPQNIFCSGEGELRHDGMWKILDFGVSRAIDIDSSLTHGQAIGTPAFMSPEQARGRTVDHRADLFGLGVLAYRALTGRPAFTGAEIPQILYDVVHGMPPRPSELVDVPAGIDDVLAVAMAKRPEDRFDSAAEMVAAFDAALAGAPVAALRGRAARTLAKFPWGKGGPARPASEDGVPERER
jgi:eukaryotic-like serine/threonine-protein kinase